MSEQVTESGFPVVPESASVVSGGPLDPTSPEGKPPEGEVVNASPEEPVYRGLTGDLKSTDDWKTYTKNLEDMLAQRMASSALQAPSLQPTIPVTPVQIPTGPSSKEKFEELIFSKPGEAYDILENAAEQRILAKIQAEKTAEDNKKKFWVNFYDKHQDLKNFEYVVQSTVKARGAEIAAIRTEAECSEFISKESRKLVDTVKKQLGVTEVTLPSAPAFAMGGSKETPTRTPSAPQPPMNFADQIRKLNSRVAGKK
jgi:hypothetical protein